jgi:hypothetical protein
MYSGGVAIFIFQRLYILIYFRMMMVVMVVVILVIMVMIMVVMVVVIIIMIVITILFILLHKHLAIIHVFSMLSILTVIVRGETRGRRIGRERYCFGSFF